MKHWEYAVCAVHRPDTSRIDITKPHQQGLRAMLCLQEVSARSNAVKGTTALHSTETRPSARCESKRRRVRQIHAFYGSFHRRDSLRGGDACVLLVLHCKKDSLLCRIYSANAAAIFPIAYIAGLVAVKVDAMSCPTRTP